MSDALIARFHHSPLRYTHVGVVVTSEVVEIKNARAGELYLWECVPISRDKGTPRDVESASLVDGVQIRRLEEVFNEDNATFGWAKLRDAHNVWRLAAKDAQKRALIRTALSELLRRTRGKPFDLNPLHALDALLLQDSGLGNGHLAPTQAMPAVPASLPETFFCSELACIIYQTCGIVPSHIDAKAVAPIELLGLSRNSGGSYFDAPVPVRNETTPATLTPSAPHHSSNTPPSEEVAVHYRNTTCRTFIVMILIMSHPAF